MKSLNEIRDAGVENYYKKTGYAPTEWAVMNFKAGFDFAVKTLQERGVVNEALFVEAIIKWRLYWMNQKQNSQDDYENYRDRASGIDANMKYHLAGLLQEAVNPILAARDERIRELEAQLADAELFITFNINTQLVKKYFAEKKG